MKDLEISFAFQPIVKPGSQEIVSYEALVRGIHDESAASIFGQVSADELHTFDQLCRVTAIGLAHKLGRCSNLNLNILPNGPFSAEEAIRTTTEAAEKAGIPLDCIILEVAEGEIIEDHKRFYEIAGMYRSQGFKLAIDDFGAGHSGLSLLADFQPDQIKLDKALIRDIESRGPRQAIVKALLQVCRDLGIDLVAEGIETLAEYAWLSDAGVSLYQGYLFGRPTFETLAEAHYPVLT